MATRVYAVDYCPIGLKTVAKECVNFRTINLIMHASKIVFKVVSQRLQIKAELHLGEYQYGFRKGHGGTRDALQPCRCLISY